jgi:monothiol glutaredoxin
MKQAVVPQSVLARRRPPPRTQRRSSRTADMSSQSKRVALRALYAAASSSKRAHAVASIANAVPTSLTSAGAAPNLRAFSRVARRGFAASADDSHDDFKPKTNASGSEDVQKMIEADVESNAVIIFMKGSPSAPQCGFSNMACRILDHHGVEYASRNVLASDELRNGIKAFSAWPTIPQLYVKGEFVGGSDIMMSMHQSGELAELFQDVKKA